MDQQEKLSLNNVGGGKLNQEFEESYKSMAQALEHGQKAKVSITIEFSRVKDTATFFNSKYELKKTIPPVKRTAVCNIDGEGVLHTDKPVEEKLSVLPLNKSA